MVAGLMVGLCWLLFILVTTCIGEEEPTGTTEYGPVSGIYAESRAGRRYMAFHGVPYALAPIGKYRFMEPQPPDTWTKVKETKQDNSKCLQYTPYGTIEGAEDCLRLNIFTHNVTRKSPVLIHFHGGSFSHGHKDMFIPTYLMDEDIVIVVPNYRVGILGFLSFETLDLPGNLGLKDQLQVLRWVRGSIEGFGGDPMAVTISGDSAGAASVFHHLLSPLSAGYFSAAILSGGSSYNPWALSPPGLGKANAKKLMTMIGCEKESVRESVDCAKVGDAKKIVEKSPEFLVNKSYLQGPMLKFGPVLEIPFFSSWYISLVPVIIIMSSAEALYRVQMIKEQSSLKEFSENFEKMAPSSLGYWASASSPDDVTRNVRDFYFPGNNGFTDKDVMNLTRMFSDVLFNHGILRGANRHKGPVYFWLFDHVGPGTKEAKLNLGADHCSEMPYLWELNIPNWKVNVTLEEEEELKLSEDMVKMVSDYMETGTPMIPDSNETWLPWSRMEQHYLYLGNTGYTMKKGLLDERYKFWDTVKYNDLSKLYD